MTSEVAPVDADRARKLTLLKAIGLDKVSPEQRELALNIAQKYELDLLLKHLVLIDGRAFITRDGLLHIAHRSGQLDGIESTEPVIVEKFWTATCSVFRKDMSHAFTYTGRYPVDGQNKKFAPEMAVKVAESMALRRAFDVAAPTADERWDAEVPAIEPPPRQTLAQVARSKALQQGAVAYDAPSSTEEAAVAVDTTDEPIVEPEPPADTTVCAAVMPPPLGEGETCALDLGHDGPHIDIEGSRWPR